MFPNWLIHTKSMRFLWLTDALLSLDWAGALGAGSHSGPVLSSHAELVHHIGLKALDSVGCGRHILLIGSRPLVGTLSAVLNDVVKDLWASVILWSLPVERGLGLLGLWDVRNSRLARLLCYLRIIKKENKYVRISDTIRSFAFVK